MTRRKFLLALPFLAAGAKAAIAKQPEDLSFPIVGVNGDFREGDAITLDYLLDAIYRLRRTRMADGEAHQVIDMFVHEEDAPIVEAAFRKDFEKRYGPAATPRVTMLAPFESVLGVERPDIGCRLAVFPIQQFGATMPRGELWFPDWSDLYYSNPPHLSEGRPERHLRIQGVRNILL